MRLQIKQFEHGWGFVGRVALGVTLKDQSLDDPLTPENEAKLTELFNKAEAADPFMINLWKTKQAAIEAGHTVIEPLN